MSPFKEPQPRKVSIQEGHEAKQRRAWPPYARQGGEANWDGGTPIVTDKELSEVRAESPAEKMLLDQTRVPIMVVPDHTQFELRKTALEAALGLGLEPNHHAALFWDNLQTFEDYLRDGTKP